MKRLVLVGRPNAGKSSVYNALTGGHARVGNHPGITVDALHGDVVAPDNASWTVVDLPGAYTLRSDAESGSDEALTRSFLATRTNAEQDVLGFVLDGTQLEVGLRLIQESPHAALASFVLLTQRDLLERDGTSVDVAGLANALGVPVRLVTSHELAGFHAVWDLICAARPLPHGGWSARELAARVTTRPKATATSVSARIDKWALHPMIGPVLFCLCLGGLFAAVFAVADPASAVLDACIDKLRGVFIGSVGQGWFSDMVSEGIFGGAGTLLTFVPQIALLSAGMAALDASGYLSRGSLLVHGVFRHAGLSGRAFAPLLMGHACAVPAISSTRTIRDPKERWRVMAVLPLTTCSARIPTYALIIQTFFGERGVFFRSMLFLGLYVLGLLLAGVAAALLAKSTGGKVGRRATMPIAIELPRYRRPRGSALLRTAARASLGFVRNVGGMVLAASVVLWGLLHLRAPAWAGGGAAGIHGSVAASLGRVFEPLTQFCGFDWRINIGLIGSFGAREVMVSTLGVVFGATGEGDAQSADLSVRLRDAVGPSGAVSYSTATGLALLVFFVIACQCSSTVAALRRESGSWKLPGAVLLWTYLLAFILATLTYQTARMLS